MGRRTDFDTPWKEALDRYLPQFFAFFHPDIHDDIDWSYPSRQLDKELRKLAPDSRSNQRVTDSLVEVRQHGGETALVLVHIEVQSHEEPEFAQRMWEYNSRIALSSKQPVCSLAVLGDRRDSWRPGSYNRELWSTRYHFDYAISKMLDYRERLAELEASSNPFALLVAATLHVRDTTPDSPQRREAKFRMVRSMFHAGLSAPDIRAFFRLVDWIMTLSPDQDESFYDDLHDLERSQNMPYITSIERRGIAKGLEQGLEQGREQGLRSAALLALESRFGPVSEAITSTIQAISNKERLTALVGSIACADSLEAAIQAVDAAASQA